MAPGLWASSVPAPRENRSPPTTTRSKSSSRSVELSLLHMYFHTSCSTLPRSCAHQARAAMASLAAAAVSVQPVAAKGLAGRKLAVVRPSSRAVCRSTRKPRAAVVAKYGDKSIYFDLEDIGNTTGQWDLYGSDAPSPYNPLQSKFFETFAGPFTKRGLLLKFLLLGGGSLLAYVSSSASPDLLPIKKGPQQPPQMGPRGKI